MYRKGETESEQTNKQCWSCQANKQSHKKTMLVLSSWEIISHQDYLYKLRNYFSPGLSGRGKGSTQCVWGWGGREELEPATIQCPTEFQFFVGCGNICACLDKCSHVCLEKWLYDGFIKPAKGGREGWRERLSQLLPPLRNYCWKKKSTRKRKQQKKVVISIAATYREDQSVKKWLLT